MRHTRLGNTVAHSLPYCQLSALQLLANHLENNGDMPTPFWIDTVCLPFQKDAKKRALSEVRRAFQLAAKTIILEPALSNISVGSAQDALFHLRYSQWKSRLWTIQEGVLSDKLYVQFKNRVWGLKDILQEYENSSSSQQLLKQFSAFQEIDQPWLMAAVSSFDRDLKIVSIA